MKFIRQYFEFLLIGFCLFTLLMLLLKIDFSDRLIVVSIALLAFYYLLSGALVLFNKQVLHGMRLIYFIGLWSVTVGLIGIVYKLRFWYNSDMLLLFAVTFNMVTLIFMFGYWHTSKKDVKVIIASQLKPILYRLLVFPVFFFFFYTISHYWLYERIGPYRDDAKYMQLYLKALENPKDYESQQEYRNYEIKKFNLNDTTGSPSKR